MIFEPASVCGIGIELGGFDAVMLASDHAPQPCEVAFCKIGVSAVEAVSLGMINPLHAEGRGEHILAAARYLTFLHLQLSRAKCRAKVSSAIGRAKSNATRYKSKTQTERGASKSCVDSQ